MNFFTTIFTTLAAILALASAMPLLSLRDVFVPPVLYPHQGTIWYVGQWHNVTWDTANHPKNITNRIGRIVLAKGGRILSSGAGSLDEPLEYGFDILAGHIEVNVPNVTAGDDYQVVLFGDSGNLSQNFTIRH